MNVHHKRNRIFYYSILVGAILFLVSQALYSNYLKNSSIQMYDGDTNSISIMRLQSLYGRAAQVAILGSSQTERLMPSEDVAVIGIPGCSFLTAWESIIPLGEYGADTILILEGNLCLNDTTEGVLDHFNDPFFKLLAGSPNFSKSSRPSTLVLSHLLNWYLPDSPRLPLGGTYDAQDRQSSLSLTKILALPTFQNEADLEERLKKRIAAIQEMKKNGYHPCLVFYPTHYVTQQSLQREQANLQAARYIAEQAGIPLLNYLGADFSPALEFTDTHHLRSTATSTTQFRNTLVRDARVLFGQ